MLNIGKYISIISFVIGFIGWGLYFLENNENNTLRKALTTCEKLNDQYINELKSISKQYKLQIQKEIESCNKRVNMLRKEYDLKLKICEGIIERKKKLEEKLNEIDNY